MVSKQAPEMGLELVVRKQAPEMGLELVVRKQVMVQHFLF